MKPKTLRDLVHLLFLGSTQLLCVEAVILLLQELEMVQYVFGQLRMNLKDFDLYLSFPW